MKLAFLACLASSVLLAGCLHTRQVGYEMSQISPEKMIRTVRGEEVVVTLDDSTVVSGVTLAIGPDTLHLQVVSGKDSVWHLPMDRVDTIRCSPNVMLGPIVGLLTGGLAGGLIGAAIGKGIESTDGFMYGTPTKAGAAIGAVIGGALGVAIGANITPHYVFVLPRHGR